MKARLGEGKGNEKRRGIKERGMRGEWLGT